MTEAEIMKALECCGLRGRYVCEEDCPRMNNGINSMSVCERDLKLDALDLINRKNAEIERLYSMNQAKLDMIHDLRGELETNDKAKAEVLGLQKEIKTARAEAIKEFGERLKVRYCNIPMWGKVAIVFMEEIAKEMGVEL